jgi:predicted tellurium resistance membrane protein TerC
MDAPVLGVVFQIAGADLAMAEDAIARALAAAAGAGGDAFFGCV